MVTCAAESKADMSDAIVILSYFPQSATPVACAVSVRRPNTRDPTTLLSLVSEDVGLAVRQCGLAVRRPTERAPNPEDRACGVTA